MLSEEEKAAADQRREKVRRELLGGGDGTDEPTYKRLDPRSNVVILPEPCPKCGSEFTDPDGQVINNQPVRGLRCEDCRHFWVPEVKTPGAR